MNMNSWNEVPHNSQLSWYLYHNSWSTVSIVWSDDKLVATLHLFVDLQQVIICDLEKFYTNDVAFMDAFRLSRQKVC